MSIALRRLPALFVLLCALLLAWPAAHAQQMVAAARDGVMLRSGASAVVEIPVTVNDAIIIPQRSTYELQGKRFVYLVNDSNKVISTEIEVMPVAAGQYFVVTGGLKPGDNVVYESTYSLQDSTVIKPDVQPENKVYNLK